MKMFTVHFDTQDDWKLASFIIREYLGLDAHFTIRRNPGPGSRHYAILTFADEDTGQKAYNTIVNLRSIGASPGEYNPA